MKVRVFKLLFLPIVLFSSYAGANIPFAFWLAQKQLDVGWTPAWNNLVGYWKADGPLGSLASGATMSATVGGCDGSVQGTTSTLISGHITQAFSTNSTSGSTGFVVPAATSPNPGSQMTVAFWFNSTHANTGGSFPSLLWKSDGTSLGWAVQQNNNTAGQIYMRIDTSAGANQATSILAGVFDGQWHHIVYTVNSGTILAYLDGANVPSAGGSYSVGGGFANSSQNLYIGIAMGAYDDIAIWNVALSSSQVSALYNRQK
jgi:hypothetical protein